MIRDVSIHQAHPRLRCSSKEVTKVIHLLDAHFQFTAADLPTLSPSAKRRAKALLKNPGPAVPEGDLSLAFFTDRALAKIHADFLDDPTTTDVITFEGDPALQTAGEICVSADTAATFAHENARDFAEELTLYVVHGWLHLAGYDDLVPRKKRRMRAAEARAMKLLRAKAAIPGFRWRTRS